MFDVIKVVLTSFVQAARPICIMVALAALVLADQLADLNRTTQAKVLLKAQCDAGEQGVGYGPREEGKPDPCAELEPKPADGSPSGQDGGASR